MKRPTHPTPQDLVAGLIALVDRLEESGPARKTVYAHAQALFAALGVHCAGRSESRTINALRREAAWHVRCLAGLEEVASLPPGQHRAYALNSLGDLSRHLTSRSP